MDDAKEVLTEADTKEKPEGPVGTTTRVDEDPLVGTMLDHRYLVKQKLGHGGFGVVYLASDQKMMSRLVVVKALLDEKINHEWSVRKFKQEMEALARIDHPSVVGIFDSGQLSDGKPYIVMQYVDGVSLRSLISPEGMPFWRAGNIIRQIGKALGAAHERGILHRDLKPENVMVQTLEDGEEQIKVIDFGVAKVKNSVISLSSGGDQAVGTAAYMSPEQLSAGTVSPASDVYCFAVIAYEILTGRRPNNPDSAFQLLELQRSGVRIKPRALRPNLSPEAETIILKALSFEPKDRYERARDFGDLLSGALLGDDEQTKLQTKVQEPSEAAETLSLETAHVLFTDIVGYTKLLIDQQTERLRKLQEIVLATDECRRASTDKDLIRLPTGDGMALVFFGDPEAPVRCAIEISRALKAQTGIELRMGVHSGLVYHIADINTNMNVAGGGINIAQRVMDCGDSGHILLSKRVADDLGQLSRWSDSLHDLGTTEVKHGLRVHVFNLYGDDFGNSEPPAKFPVASKPPIYKSKAMIAAVSLAILGLAIAGAWYALRPRTTVVSQPTRPETIAAVGSEQSLTYWLTVQKMLNHKPLGAPIESTGNILFGNGWKFRFNLRPMQSGALYLLNVGPGKNGAEEYDILFPVPRDKRQLPSDEKLDARLAANQTVQLPLTEWYRFVEQTGVEKLWIIWSAQPIPELDAIFSDAARNRNEPGVIANPDQITQIQSYLKKYDSAHPEVLHDMSKKLTSVKGRGNILVNLVELSHEPI
jgi:serine/threonine protein kinase